MKPWPQAIFTTNREMTSLLRRRTQPLKTLLTNSKLAPIKPSQNPQPPIPCFPQQSRVSKCQSFSTQSPKFPEYEMPSVTWGVVQGRKEKLVSRVIICDYLKGIGIVPDELEDLELPSTVEVMRERVEFLQKIGLTIDNISEYPLMLGCSVRKNIIPVLGYLEKIGIQRSRLGEFVKNYPQVLHASVVVELVPVVKFLRGLDVEKQDMGYVLMKYPELLGFKLEGTMSTSVAYLVSIGVNPRDIGPMVTQYPYFLGMRVGTMIKPLVDYLLSLGLPKKIIARMLEKRAYILGYDLEETVKPNVDCLISFGIRREALASIIAQYPQTIGLPLKAKLSTQQYFFNFKLKIDPDGFAQVIERMPQIVSLNQNVIMKHVEFLVGRGIPVEDAGKMVVNCPQLVAVQVGLMKNSYYFFKSEMGRPVNELVEFPEYFTYSLESRIKPRYQKLQSKGIRCSLAWFLNCSDKRFEERLQADYLEIESAGPSFCMGGKLELPGSEVVSDVEDESDDEILYRRTVSLYLYFAVGAFYGMKKISKSEGVHLALGKIRTIDFGDDLLSLSEDPLSWVNFWVGTGEKQRFCLQPETAHVVQSLLLLIDSTRRAIFYKVFDVSKIHVLVHERRMNKFTILLSKCSSATVQSRRSLRTILVLIMLLMLFKLLQRHEDNEAVEYRECDIIVQKRHGHSERIGKHASSTNNSQGCFSIKKMIRQNVMIVEKAYPRNGFTNGKSFKSWSVLIQSAKTLRT
ncbi:unnamed protein product [Camellia sinensis]